MSPDSVPHRVAEVVFDPEEMLTTLARHHVQYVLIGGLAGRLHGSPLATMDLDITPADSASNLTALCTALNDLDAQLRVPGADEGVIVDLVPGWFRAMTSMTFITRVGMLDLAFRPDALEGGFEQLMPAAVTMQIFGIEVHVAALDDIISSKRAAGRTKDRAALPYLEEMRRQTQHEIGHE